MMQIEPTGQACGAVVTGVDLAGPLAAETVAAIRAAWLQHHVLAFPDQRLSDDDLERFTPIHTLPFSAGALGSWEEANAALNGLKVNALRDLLGTPVSKTGFF